MAKQAAMLQLACLVADAVAEALTERVASDRPKRSRCVRLDAPDLARLIGELRRRGLEVMLWSVQLTPFRRLHR